MNNLLECYRILGVDYGAGLNEIASSYRRLCRIYHPDVNNDPNSWEEMKRINTAYKALREKLKREASTRERQAGARISRKNWNHDARQEPADAKIAGDEAEKEAFAVLESYFQAISEFDYSGAYAYLSACDKRLISSESFIEWRKSVARVFPMREFKIVGGMSVATVNFNDGKTLYARRFRVAVTEEYFDGGATRSDNVEKLVIYENGYWKVFLGYSGVGELTREFDERFEVKLKNDAAKRWEEYYTGLYPEYDMLSLTGLRKAVLKEIYRQKRFGGTLTFAVISVQAGGARGGGQEELLRSSAKTISAALRETDISAYSGDGVFAILFVGLRKKNADEILRRLIEKIRRGAGASLGARADIGYTFGSWSGNGCADFDAMNKILKRYHKKM